MQVKLILRFLFTLRLNKCNLVSGWSVSVCMYRCMHVVSKYVRHIQLSPIWGCSRVQLLRHTKSQQTFIQESPLMHKPGYHVCKGFHRRLRKPLCHSFLHVVARREFEGFHNGPKMWKSHGIAPDLLWVNKSKASPCCTTVLAPLWPTEFRNRRMACCGQCQTPCISPWDFHIFRPFRKALRSCIFPSHEDMQKTVV